MRTLTVISILLGIVTYSHAQFDNCFWIEPDDSYIHPDVAEWPGSFGSAANNYSAPIDLPFDFHFFGQTYNQVILTTEGTIVMGNTGYIDFLPSAFPNPLSSETTQQYNHICGFWSDFDFNFGGDLYYKVTNEALYVNYIDVGTWSLDSSKKNSFQMIIAANGNNIIGNGNNVQFYYKDMNWVNSLISGASGGLAADANLAIVGADKESGPEHFAFGRFNFSSDQYNGPYGIADNQQDGVKWLEGRNIEFNTATSSSNMPPAIAANFCPSLKLCGDYIPMDIHIISSESSQNIGISVSGLPLGMTYSTVNYTSALGINFTIDFEIIAPGNYQIELVATDNGTPSESSTYQFELNISSESYDLQISGDTEICAGADAVWSATPGMDHYFWENGDTTSSIVIHNMGIHHLIATKNDCILSTFQWMDVTPFFIPQLDNNVLNICPYQDTSICVLGEFESYEWFVYPGYSGEFVEGTPLNEACVSVQGVNGNYGVIVTDEDGCEGFNIKLVYAPNVVLPETTFTEICGIDNLVEISGGYFQESDNLIFYGLSTNQNGWQGSYLQIKVFHLDGSVDSVYFTTFSALSQLTNLETITGDSISIEYFANGNDFAGNSLWFINCGETTPTIFNAPLTSGILWSGMSTCDGLPLTGQWMVDGPDGWTLSDITTYNTQFQSNTYSNYTLCFTPDVCENSYCYEIQIENEPSLEFQLSDTMLLCGSESVVIVPIANPQYDINWQGEGLDIASDNLSATAGPYIGYGETDIMASQTNICGTSADSIHIIYLNELNPGLAEEMFTCDELLLDPFPGASNDAYIDCIWTDISTNEAQYTPTYNITAPGLYSGQFSNECYNTQPILFEVIFEDTLIQSGELNGELVFCDNEGLEVFSTVLTEASYYWYLDPPQAGTIINSDLNQVTLDFTDGFAGNATISVVLSNSCGSTDPAELEVLIDDCSGVKENQGSAFHIYPNPAQDFLIIEGKESIESIKIFDQLGQELWCGSNKRIDIRNLPAGIYLISIDGQNGTSIYRVEILR